MALLLVFGSNNTHVDVTKDRRGCYKLGAAVDLVYAIEFEGEG